MPYDVAGGLKSPNIFGAYSDARQTQLQNALVAGRESRAQTEFNNSLADRTKAQSDAEAAKHAAVGLAASQSIAVAPPGQVLPALQRAIQDSPEVAQFASDYQRQSGHAITDLPEDSIRQIAHMGIQHFRTIAGQGPAAPQVIQTTDGGQTSLYNPDTRTATPLVTNPKDRPTEMTPYEQARIDLERRKLNQQSSGGAAKPSDTLAPDAVHDAVIDTLADPNRMRQYASFGQSGQSNRNAINNAKAKLLRDIGLTEQEVIRQQAVAKGQVKSVSDLIGMQNAVSAYETVAQGNGDRVLELVDKVNTAGIPILNSAKRIGEQALGNPDAAELMQVLQNYQTEVARIIANPRLVGQLTDTARKEIMQTVPANMTPAQAKRIVNRLNFEFELRNRGISDAISNAQGQMVPGFNQTTPATTPATGQPIRVNTPEEAMKLAPGTVFITPDGRQKVR